LRLYIADGAPPYRPALFPLASALCDGLLDYGRGTEAESRSVQTRPHRWPTIMLTCLHPDHGPTGGDDCHAGHKGPSGGYSVRLSDCVTDYLISPENDGKQCICQRCPVHPPLEPKPEVKVEMFACGHRKGGRNLIVCIDGTANQFGSKVCGINRSATSTIDLPWLRTPTLLSCIIS
jgi:hypothetical protein